MKSSSSVRARLDKLQGYFEAKRSVVVRAVFGENAEFGSVRFRHKGGKTEVLELCEPEPIESDGHALSEPPTSADSRTTNESSWSPHSGPSGARRRE